jgi:transcriptional regulator with XRE-family HTH domain
MTLGAYIRQARQQCGLTQAQLAARCGVTREAISRLKRHQRLPSLRVLGHLMHALALNPLHLCEILRRLPDAKPTRGGHENPHPGGGDDLATN